MAVKQKSAWCPDCNQQRFFIVPKPNHVLHLLRGGNAHGRPAG